MLTIRPARPGDETAIARVHVDSWRTTYRGIMPDDVLAGQSVERRERQWTQSRVPVGEKPETMGTATITEISYAWPDLSNVR
jgi:hypothetical protein